MAAPEGVFTVIFKGETETLCGAAIVRALSRIARLRALQTNMLQRNRVPCDVRNFSCDVHRIFIA